MKTAQVSLTAGAVRAFGLASALGLAALAAALYLGTPADAARPHVIVDMCNQTSGGAPEGLKCNFASDLLVRLKYSDGSCSDWICCPSNGDGTYDCEHGSSPGGSAISGRARALLGPRFAVAVQGERPRRPKTPAVTAPRQPRTINPN